MSLDLKDNLTFQIWLDGGRSSDYKFLAVVGMSDLQGMLLTDLLIKLKGEKIGGRKSMYVAWLDETYNPKNVP